MKRHFSFPDYEAQFLRAMGYTYYGGADIGECLTTAARIKEAEPDSWYQEWFKIGQRIYKEAEESAHNSCKISSRSAYFRASNYFRASYFFLSGYPVDERLKEAYRLHVKAFEQAIESLDTPVEKVSIPYEGTFLPGYLFRTSEKEGMRPVLIANGGYDSTCQESFWMVAAAALQRGYHVLCFDGPGQGSMLIDQQIPMRHDWEKVIEPVIDFLEKQPGIDPHKIALYGPSWGGMLAARAACFEKRLAALVVNPGQYDALIPFKKAFPDAAEVLKGNTAGVEQFLTTVLSERMMAARFRTKMWVHHVDSPVALLKCWSHYNLEGLTSQIQCPTLVADSENESMSAGQAQLFYEALHCPKDYRLFTQAEGAGEHCEAGASSLFHACMFDWLQLSTQKAEV